MRRDSALRSIDEGLAWLRDAAGELSDVPVRLHTNAVQPSDLLGAPKMSAPFLARVAGSAFAIRSAPRYVRCPALHPRRRYGEPVCAMCGDTGEWLTTTDVYERPLAAALAALRSRGSSIVPHPAKIVDALLPGCDLERAAARLELEPGDRRFLSAIRSLYDLFSWTAIAA